MSHYHFLILSLIIFLFVYLSFLSNPTNICENIVSDIKTECLAIITRNISLCKALLPTDAENCINTIAISIGIDKKDFHACEKYNLSTDICYWTLASLMNKIEPCKNIKKRIDKLSCFAFITKNTSYCNGYESCRYYAEISKRNVSYCETIFGLKTINCLSDIALIEKNTTLCERIKMNKNLNEKTKTTYSDKCYYNIALKIENMNLCYKINSHRMRTTCLALIQRNPYICENIKNGFYKDYCLFLLAMFESGVKQLLIYY